LADLQPDLIADITLVLSLDDPACVEYRSIDMLWENQTQVQDEVARIFSSLHTSSSKP
jgi:hypothetical protein